jgi:hypothetical protein
MNKRKKMQFDNLPKGVKEEIWSYLDEKEYYKIRLVSNYWKNNLENPKSLELKEKFKNANETKEKWRYGFKFYRGCCFTSKVLSSLNIHVRLECCYGTVYETRQENYPKKNYILNSYKNLRKKKFLF